jgi:hypothetical protein
MVNLYPCYIAHSNSHKWTNALASTKQSLYSGITINSSSKASDTQKKNRERGFIKCISQV